MIEQHVTSLELSMRLKELGFDKLSFFVYLKPEAPQKGTVTTYGEVEEFELIANDNFPDNWEYYPAYLATELLERLPEILYIDEDTVLGGHTRQYTLRRERINGVISPYLHIIYYRNWDYIILGKLQNKEENECNALAKMLIYLVENGLMEVGK